MSTEFTGKTYWLVGASEGLGRALAIGLDRLGARMIVSARSQERLEDLCGELSDARAIAVDVTDQASVDAAIADAGDVDGVIYCVGQYTPMAVTEWDLDKSLLMVEANFIGAMRVFSRVAPKFFERGNGHIVVIGSLAGFHGLPGAIGYSASKGAVMQLAENMFVDAKGSDVKVQQINPGFIQTRLSQKNTFDMTSIMTPEEAANRVIRAMSGSRFRTSFPKPFAWVFTIGRLLPSKLYRKIF